jgi:hypothetical protein
MIKLESASKNQPREVSLAFGTPLGVGTCHGHLDTQDSPWPGLGSKPPPYSLYYTLRYSAEEAPEWHILLGLPKNCPEIVPTGLPEL